MASIILRFHDKVVHTLSLFCFLLLVHKGDAYEFVVGGQKGWSVPSDPNSNPYNQWAEKSRFQAGDSLVFNYQSGRDSVMQVNSEDYGSCKTEAQSEKFSDGHTVIKLNKSGPHYFISGNKDNCLKNEKLVVIVLADRSNRNSTTNQTSPSPSPYSPSLSPSPSPSYSSHSSYSSSPSSGSTESSPPSPAPTQQEAPSPQGTMETNPTPVPVSEAPPSPPNAASSILLSFAGSLGAFMASLMVLSF